MIIPLPDLKLALGLVAREPGQYRDHPSLLVPVQTVGQLRRYLAVEPGAHLMYRNITVPAGADEEAADALHEARVALMAGCHDADDAYDLPDIQRSRWCGLYLSVRHEAFSVGVELREEDGRVEPYGWTSVHEHVVSAGLAARIRRAVDALGGGE